VILSSSSNSNSNSIPPFKEGDRISQTISSLFMIGLPFVSVLFPQLEQLARSFPANSPEQFEVVTALFVSNRIYLYALSATIVALAGLRGSTDSPQLGQRITDLTEELLYRPSLVERLDPQPILEGQQREQTQQKTQDDGDKPAMIQSMTESGLSESLNQLSTEKQALFLPLLVSALLAISVFLLPIWNGPTNVVADDAAIFVQIQVILSEILPKISQAWNIGLLALFTRQEIRRLGFEVNLEVIDSSTIEWIIAISITAVAFFTKLWQAQNFVNMALAILVARAIQLNKFPAILGALSLLTLYDASSVFFIPAAANAMEYITATTPDNTALLSDASSPAASAMGSVAIQKLTSATFQPGLLVTKIGDQLGGGLGLGDAVFPSLLVNFARRFDLEKEDDSSDKEQISLFKVSMTSYIIGCLACEFAPRVSSGLPALVFIIPSMLVSVILASAASGDLADLWKFDPKMGLDENNGDSKT